MFNKGAKNIKSKGWFLQQMVLGKLDIHMQKNEIGPLSFFKFLFTLFVYFWLRWVFVAACGLFLVVASRGYSSLWCAGQSLWWLLLLQSMGSRRMGFSSCGMRAQQLWLTGSRAQAQWLWRMGLVALQHVGSSWTRAQTHAPCIGRQILNHGATREVLGPLSYTQKITQNGLKNWT